MGSGQSYTKCNTEHYTTCPSDITPCDFLFPNGIPIPNETKYISIYYDIISYYLFNCTNRHTFYHCDAEYFKKKIDVKISDTNYKIHLYTPGARGHAYGIGMSIAVNEGTTFCYSIRWTGYNSIRSKQSKTCNWKHHTQDVERFGYCRECVVKYIVNKKFDELVKASIASINQNKINSVIENDIQMARQLAIDESVSDAVARNANIGDLKINLLN
jgi:hypothetical protein